MGYEDLAENHEWQEWDGGGLVGVNLFWRADCLGSARAFLAKLGYREVVLDCSRVAREGVHEVVKESLGLPDWFGANWNAYYEAFEGGFGIEPSERIAFVLLHAGALDNDVLHLLIDGAAVHDRQFLFEGGRLAVLVQTDDPSTVVDPVGAQHVGWNQREFLDANRWLDNDGPARGSCSRAPAERHASEVAIGS